jgi:broad specificity phosphatase PhoE
VLAEKTMAQLFLVRHAQASFGAEDYDNLSELGHQQAALLGEYFKARNQQFDLVVTGDMRRHMQTSDGIHKSIESNSFECNPAWNEFDFNAIVTAYLTIFPQHKPASGSPRSEWYKVLRSAMIAWSKNSLSSYAGESWTNFRERVNRAAQDILESEHKNVMVVTSGGAMAVFLMGLLNSSVEQAVGFNLQIKNTSVNQFFFNSKGYQLSSFNNVPHLDTPEKIALMTYS